MVKLTVQAGDSGQKSFPIGTDKVTIGRSMKNDIILSDSSTSREHAEIYIHNGRYYIRDLGSTHGTFIDDVRLKNTTPLHEGAAIRIGSTLLQIEGIPEIADDKESLTAVPHKQDVSPAESMNPSSSTITYSMRSDSGIFQNVSRAQQHSTVLRHLADAMKAVFDIDELLPTLMDTLFDIFKPDRGVIMMVDDESGLMVTRCQHPEGKNIRISQTVIDRTINGRMSVLVSDIAADEHFSASESIMTQSILSAICCPLLGKDRILGLIYIDTQLHKMHYTKDDLALLNIIAANAAIAIENAKLLHEKVRAERMAAFGIAVAGISHFAKNVIAGIQGSSELMNMALEREDMSLIRKAWPILQRSNAKISVLVQDMLSYAKPREPEWMENNIGDLLKEIFESQQERAKGEKVGLKIELDPNLKPSQYDSKMIHDALLNLTTNAIEACNQRENASVTLSALQQDERIEIQIIDTGPGIPKEIVPRLFEPFFSTKGSKGTGLGLAVTKKAIEEHGGNINIQTEEGKGTTFQIHLPTGPPSL